MDNNTLQEAIALYKSALDEGWTSTDAYCGLVDDFGKEIADAVIGKVVE